MRTVARQIQWPVRGVEAVSAYHDIATSGERRTYAAPFALNVRPRGAIEGRRRGGSLPGFTRRGAGDIYPVHPVSPHWRGRLVRSDGEVWMLSRVGDATDFDFGADGEDVTRAIAGTLTNSGAANQNGDITALMPINDSHLYMATARSLWCLIGDPVGGNLSNISPEIGVSGAKAWCWSGSRLFFLSSEGLYGLVPGERPVHLSGALPNLKGTSDTMMGHDPKENALHIVGASGHGCANWFVDLEGEHPSFWPVSYSEGEQPSRMDYGMVDGELTMLFGRATGGSWYYDDAVAATAPSLVALGPFRMSSDDARDGFLSELHVATAQGSADVTATVYTGRTAEEAVDAAKTGGGSCAFSFVGGYNAVWRPRVRGAWCVITLESQGLWAYESIYAEIKHTGRLRP